MNFSASIDEPMKTNFASPFSRRGFLRSMVGGSLLYPGLLSQLLAEDAVNYLTTP